MKRATQTLLLAITGAVLLRMAVGDAYLRYVNSWMRWPLIACGVLLIGLALVDVFREQGSQDDEHEAHVPRAAWLLFAPSLVFFLIAPPALGAHFAERAQSAVVPVETSNDPVFAPLPEDDPLPTDGPVGGRAGRNRGNPVRGGCCGSARRPARGSRRGRP